MDTYNRSIIGLKSRSNGEYFEKMIMAASRFYEDRGIAVIDKTPEAFKVIKPYNRDRGQFICCFTQQAQPDFKGALMDSTMVLFDAKHTDKGQISRNVVTEEQEECFERYMKMGAMCFLVISLEFEEFYRVPWIVFRDMKKIYGHKYMNREELAPYRVKYNNGVVKYLDGITLRDKNEVYDRITVLHAAERALRGGIKMAIFHKTLQYHEDTTKKRELNQEDVEFLKRLQLEMNTQDTTGTADPRFWVIKGSERAINNEDPDELCLQVDGSTVTSTTEETVKYLNDNILPDNNIDRENCRIETGYTQDFELTYMEDGEEVYEDLSTQEVNEFLANNGHDDTMIIGISIRPFMYPNTMFLTEKEAREHLERNHYHYSEDAHTYCMVAWRSPEVEKLWKILRETKWD